MRSVLFPSQIKLHNLLKALLNHNTSLRDVPEVCGKLFQRQKMLKMSNELEQVAYLIL